ncbi:MAG: glycosyltransferase family 2 protein [Planctomycetes bacterium]|nr:glycosyltransferase family 2 protein [Planctomycetota bacterium]
MDGPHACAGAAAPATPGDGRRVAVVVPTLRGEPLLAGCLEALDHQRFRGFRVVVVDNGGGRAAEWLRRAHPEVAVQVPGGNVGFAAAVNLAIEGGTEPLLALLNDDARPEPDWLAALVAALDADSSLSFVCGKVVAADDPGRIDSAGDGLSRLLLPYPIGRFERDTGQYGAVRPVLLPPGSAVLVRRALFEDAGPLEASFFAYFEDADLGLRAALLGHRGGYIPGAVARHLGSATSGSMINAHTVRLSTRNLVRAQVRNLPGGVACRRGPALLAGHAYWFLKMAVKEAHPLAWLRGFVGGLVRVPGDLGARRRLLRRRRVDDRALVAMFDASAAEVAASVRRKRGATSGVGARVFNAKNTKKRRE